ncbi:MAG: M48 family metalloprotease [Ignavibacteriales bacterium]|nr:M48 family metalloprotease [Ignavibacteriales bacterium]
MKRIFYTLTFCSVFILCTCDVLDDINLFSLQDDVALGEQVALEIANDPYNYPILNNPTLKSNINSRIFQQVLASSKVEHKDVFQYHIEIINDDNTMNAFAIPGGRVYVYTGLIKYLDSEDALAGVIGHEIAHIENRHSTERLTQYYGVSLLLSIVLGDNPDEITEIVANLFVGLAFLANSRSDEDEADSDSFEYLRDTRFYPGGVKFFFEELQFDGYVESSSPVATFFSTHPDPYDRITNVSNFCTNNGYSNITYDNTTYTYNGTTLTLYKSEYQTYIISKL